MTKELLKENKRKEFQVHMHSNDGWFDKPSEINNASDIGHASPIRDFYKDQTIFITGATGFLGTLLVEKLLRCCPHIHKLILLVRSKKSASVEDRIRDHFNDEIFDRMRLTNPAYSEKVNIVCGQLDADGFGLSSADEKLLTAQTSIVFHIAATVRFDEPIRTAYDINVRGTQTAIALAKKMPRLKSFVYVSTAYSNCDRPLVKEEFYPPTLTAKELSLLVNFSSDEEIAILKEHLIDRKPNSYTLTKAAAEDLIREESHELPICVFRPSIVFPTLEEPMPLWIKGFNGVLGLCVAGGTGLLRATLVKTDITVDIVPADRTINAMTALAWYQTSQPGLGHQKVFNFVSYNDNNVNLKEFLDFEKRVTLAGEESCDKVFWKFGFTYTSNVTLYYILFYMYHIIPAIVVTCAEKLTHRKPLIMTIYRKIFFYVKTLAYFSLNEWQFENDNTRAMVAGMTEEDRSWCDSSVANFRWESMFLNIPRTCGKYLLKEPLTKEHYQTKIIYLVWADDCLRLILKFSALYVFLDFVAHMINYYSRDTF